MVVYNKLDNWETNSYIITNQAIGAVVSTERHTNDSWDCMLFPVSKGDNIFIIAQGGDDPRGVAILDDEYKLIYNSAAQTKTNRMMIIEQDGFVVVNNRKATFTTPKVFHYPFSQDNTDLGRVYTTHNHGEDTTEEYQARNIGKGYIQDNNYQPGDFNVNEQVTLMGKYGVTKIGNQLWTTENLDEELGTLGVDEWYYNGRSKSTYINSSTSTNKVLSADYNWINIYDWDNGFISTSPNPAKIPGKYFRIHYVATMNKVQLAPVDLYIRPVGKNDAGDIIAYAEYKIGTIPTGETTVTVNTSVTFDDIALRNGIGRLDFRTTRSGTGIDGTTRIDFTDIKVFPSTVAYTSTPTSNVLSVPQALANEENYKSKNYGRLYTKTNIYSNFSKLNLEGWHVPSKNELDKLFEYVDNDTFKLRSNSNSWNSGAYKGTDDYGFSAEPSGYKTVKNTTLPDNIEYYGNGARFRIVASNGYDYQFETTKVEPTLGLRPDSDEVGYSIRLVLDLNPDGSYPENATPLKLRETYKPYNRNIGTGAKHYIPNDDGKVYVDDVRCDIVCPHDKPETSETLSLASEPVSEPIIEE